MQSLGLPFPAMKDESPTASWRPPELTPLPSNLKSLALDFETDGLKWWDGDLPVGVAVYHPGIGSKYYPFGHAGGGNLPEEQVKAWVRNEIQGKTIYCHNTKFEVHMAREWGTDFEKRHNRVADTAHYAALLDDHRKRFALEFLAPHYLGEEKVGKDLASHEMALYPSSMVAPRAEADARQTWDLQEKMRPLMEKEGLDTVKTLEEDLIYVTCEMEKNGVHLDTNLLEQWNDETFKESHQIRRDIADEVGFVVNPSSPDDLFKLARYFDLPISLTAKGSPSFTDAVVSAYEHPIFNKVKRARNLSELRSRYLSNYSDQVGADGLLRYALHQLRTDEGGTISGRYSSAALIKKENIGCNIQQVMKAAKQRKSYGDDHIIRQLFIPGPGMLWFSADAEQIEYRLFAHYANNPTIIQLYKDKPDHSFHQMIMDLLQPFAPYLTYRQVKDLNFANIYGAGLAKLALMLKFITQQQFEEIRATENWRSPLLQSTKDVKAIYEKEIPEATNLLKLASRQASNVGWVRTLMGRRCRFPNKFRLHKALNGVIQGGAADIMKKKLVELHKERRYTQLLMRFPVHDEINGDIPDAEHAKRVSEILEEQTTPTRVPILWDSEVGNSWLACE